MFKRNYRSDARFKDVSIAIYSTSSHLLKKDIEETFVEGANIYIKPNDFNKSKKVIKEAFKHKLSQ
jgi:hypothetical protein